MKFNGEQFIQFWKSSFEFEEKLMGSLGKRYLINHEIEFNKYMDCQDVFLFDHGNYGNNMTLFCLNEEGNLYIDLLDSQGKLVNHIPRLLKTSDLLAGQSTEYYVLSGLLEENTDSVFGHPITRTENDKAVLTVIDKQFNYLRHKVVRHNVAYLACNDSNIVCIDDDDNFYLYDMDLNLAANQPFNTIKEKIGNDLYRIVMNDNNLFILCKDNEVLRIFNLNTFDLVKEIGSKADEIKLVSDSYFILTHCDDQVAHLYSQLGVFEKLDQVELSQDDLYSLNCDKSSNIIMYHQARAKSLSFNTLFNIPMI
jgi:hypothetical protein